MSGSRVAAAGRLAMVLIVALGLVAVQGCGRKGSPEKPEGSQFPRQYPYYPDLPK